MAHVRRKFMDIVKITKKPGIASKIIDIISKLYDIERMAKELPYEQIYQTDRSAAANNRAVTSNIIVLSRSSSAN